MYIYFYRLAYDINLREVFVMEYIFEGKFLNENEKNYITIPMYAL